MRYTPQPPVAFGGCSGGGWPEGGQFNARPQGAKDPPDCIAEDVNGAAVAIEVTGLVSGEAVRMNEQGRSVYRDWTPPEVVREIEQLLVQKDSKSYHRGP